MHKVTRHGTALIRHWHILKLTHQGSTEPGAESDIQTRRQYVLLLFLIYSFLTIASDQLSQSTGPIFTKFSGLIQLWLQINDLKLIFRSLKGRCHATNFCWLRSQAASGAAGRVIVELCPNVGNRR